MSDKRPGQNSDGQSKQPSANPNGGGKPNPTAPTSLVPPGIGGGAPGGGPQQTLRDTLNYKDLDPILQMQMAQKAGLNPMSPIQMIQQNLQSSFAAGSGDNGPVPNAMVGPMVPPEVAGLPHDMGQLQQAMAHGYAPGSTYQEHAMGMNAHAMMRALEQQSQQQAQNPQAPDMGPAMSSAPLPQMAPQGPQPGMGAPPMGPAPMDPNAAPAGPPQMDPNAPPAPAGLPPEIMQALQAHAAQQMQPLPTRRKQLQQSK